MYAKDMKTTFVADHTSGSPAESVRVHAGGPGGLVELGDETRMKHWIYMHGGGGHASQDDARDALFRAASDTLILGKGGRPLMMRLYAIPIAFSVSCAAAYPSTQSIGSTNKQSITLKLRELWSLIFGAAAGLSVAPHPYATNTTEVLSVSPVLVRDCLRHGAALAQGTSKGQWSFDGGNFRNIGGSAEVPVGYVLGAYVMWEAGLPEPVPHISPRISLDLQQFLRAVLAKPGVDIRDMKIGQPMFFHDAVSESHGLQSALMVRRTAELGGRIGRTFDVRGDTSEMNVYIFEESGEEDPVFQFRWTYSSLWRPHQHQVRISELMHEELALIERRHAASHADDVAGYQGVEFSIH